VLSSRQATYGSVRFNTSHHIQHYKGTNMDFLSTAVLSGIAYDILKKGLSLSASNLKEKLKDWAEVEIIVPRIAEELNKLALTDDMSEKAIERSINQSQSLLELLTTVKKPQVSNVIVQHHTGSGDNIGRNKIIK